MSVLKVIFGVLLREVREPKLCTKFEVANFNGCRNNYGTTSEGISTLTTSIYTSPLVTAIPPSSSTLNTEEFTLTAAGQFTPSAAGRAENPTLA